MRRHSETYSKGLPALHWAAIRGHTGVIDTLLEANAGIDMRDSQKQPPLHRAVMFGPSSAVQHLIHNKATSMPLIVIKGRLGIWQFDQR
jgi:ankyrin repeat protein